MTDKIKMIDTRFFMMEKFSVKVDNMRLECNAHSHALEYAGTKEAART